MQAIDEHQKLQPAGESSCSTVAGAKLHAVTKNLALQLQLHSDRQQFALVVRVRYRQSGNLCPKACSSPSYLADQSHFTRVGAQLPLKDSD